MQADPSGIVAQDSAARHVAALAKLSPSPETAQALAPLAMPAHAGLDARLSRIARKGAALMVKTWHTGALDPFSFTGAFAAAQLAGDTGIGPAVVQVLDAEETLVMEDLGPRWRPALVPDFLTEAALADLVALKRRWHRAGRVDTAISALALFEAMLERADHAARLAQPLTLPATIAMGLPQIADWARHIAAALDEAGQDPVLLHGENTVSNVMLGADGAMRLVDFDRATMGCAYRDLGAMSNDLCTDDAERGALLAAYIGHAPGRDHMARLKLNGLLDDASWALWAIHAETLPDCRGPELYKYACNRALRFRINLSTFDMPRLFREL